MKVEYNPGATTMQVSYKMAYTRVGVPRNAFSSKYMDGFGFMIPPVAQQYYPGHYDSRGSASDSPLNVRADFNSYVPANRQLYYVVQRCDTSRDHIAGGVLADGAWHTFTYDISQYKAGDSPVLFSYVQRGSLVNGAMPYSCISKAGDYTTATMGLSVKVAPKITASSTEGGTTSHTGEKYYEYNKTSDTYTWTPNPGYKIKDVKIDEKSQGAISSYTFPNVVVDHTISVEFEKIRVSLICFPNTEDAIGEMIPIQTDALTDATVPECSYTYKGRKFASWNTSPDGTGTTYKPGEEMYVEEQDVALYAQWEDIPHTVTWTDSLTGEVFHTETVLDTFPAPFPPLPEHEGYKAVLPCTEEELSNITEDKNYSVSYELIPYTISVELISKDTGKSIAPTQTYTQPFRSTLAIDAYIKEIYVLDPDMVSVMDADTGEAISPQDVFSMMLDDFGRVSEMTCNSTPARNLAVKLLYNCSIKMPETGSPDMAVLMALGTIIVGAFIACRASNHERKQ